MKILHVAPINVAGVPMSMVHMHRRFGHESRLVTLHTNTLTFDEDVCLAIPLPRNPLAQRWRHHKRSKSSGALRIHRSRNIAEALYFRYDDRRRSSIVEQALERYRLEDFDIVHYDGGLDFFRDARVAKRWKMAGKKIICHYLGSDLRVRGIDPQMDSLSDLNITNESDHLLLHPNIHYLYIPFDVAPYRVRQHENSRLRIVHSPTNRSAKGTELILPIMNRVVAARNVEFVLIEQTPHDEVLRIKETCDIAIEQVGNLGGTGYGRNSLETLALGIPTITEMTPDYTAWLPENPFILATPKTLYDRLLEVIDNPTLRRDKRDAGRGWVERYHSFEAVHRRLTELYRTHGIC